MERSDRQGTTVPVPAERSSFVGRRRELAEVRRLLSGSRLTTLVGPGGVGKTRLALRAAAEMQRSFRDGTAVADVAAVRDPALVVQQVAAALGVRDDSGRWLTAGLADAIGERQLLLVLDNCEHLRDSCAVLADALMRNCPELRLLATSRQPLDVDGESLVAVMPLAAPPVGASGDVFSYDAVQLLHQRARAAAPGLSLTAADAQDLAELCRRLDGLPLAIELAAVRFRTLTPAEVVTRLDDRFRLLRRSGSSIPERHRSLRATLEWSYEPLAEAEKQLWQRASVFAADFDLAAVEAVCGADGGDGAGLLDPLTGLVDASVVEVAPDSTPRRFRMLETVRAFGRELLLTSGSGLQVQLRHRDWCAGLASSASVDFVGAGQVAAFERLDVNHAELSAALAFCLHTPGEEATGLIMASDLWLYWEARGHLGEGRRWLDRLLAAGSQPPDVRARGLAAAGYLALAATDARAARTLLEEARDLADAHDQPLVGAVARQYLGQAALFGGDLRSADELLRAAAARYRDADDRREAFCWADIGVAALLDGRRQSAAEAFERSLDLNQGGDPWTRSHALWGLGLVRLDAGDPAGAAELEQEALRLIREVDDRSGIALCIGALSWVAAAQQDWDRAARLSGAADAIWRSIPAEVPGPVSVLQDRHLRPAGRALAGGRWSSQYDRGSSLERSDAIALALGESPVDAPSQPTSGTGADMLTRRQREVAELVSLGLTDREIAARLVVSPRTAESHVEQIRTRLGFRSRAEIAAWFVRQV